MSLGVGSRLGHYEVTAKIGEGGMGEVWEATDTKLNRQVALKILPEAFSSDPDRLARFQREAQVLASLNHPNIGQIHGIEDSEGTKALVLELVEGPTLADRIARGPIPVDEALPIAKQIAEALEAAHEAGVIHRDLKPANIKVREDGTVKVLDFGLAKALDTSPEGDPSLSPTLTAAATQMGVIMGTAAYMSPEQAKGREVDRRADVWAFGCVLYEMLTGRQVFAAEDVSTILARVLERDPDFTTLPVNLDPKVSELLDRCLQKDVKRRYHDIADVRLDLERALADPRGPLVQPVDELGRSARQSKVSWVTVGVVAGGFVFGLIAWFIGTPADTPQPVRRFAIVLPASETLTPNNGLLVALSPDGETLVYRAQYMGEFQLFQRRMDQLEATPVPGTEGAGQVLVFSPDGGELGFRIGSDLMRVSLDGGQPVRVAEIGTNFRGASWGTDGTIIPTSVVRLTLLYTGRPSRGWCRHPWSR